MSERLDLLTAVPNACGCCEGVALETPVEIDNRPGLAAVAYRVGSYGQFRASLLARLASSAAPFGALAGLRTRDADDFTIALLDAWATVADVVTFYQERIANESYLRTATERLSVVQLARLIGYRPAPGVAAHAYLAFTVEDAPTSPHITTIDAGARVQSIPGPGQQPQTFETMEKIEARADWNAMRPKRTIRHPIDEKRDTYFFAGVGTGLRPGDGLLVTPDDGSPPLFRLVSRVTPVAAQGWTEVQIQALPPPPPAPPKKPVLHLGSLSAPAKALFGQKITMPNLQAVASKQLFILVDLFRNLVAAQPPPPSVEVFRTRAAVFGHNAPDWSSLPATQRFGEIVRINKTTVDFRAGVYSTRQNSWSKNDLASESFRITNDLGNIAVDLDTVYPAIKPGTDAVLRNDGTWRLFNVKDVFDISRADFTLSTKVTQLTFTGGQDLEKFQINNTTVYAQSETLDLARLPRTDSVADNKIELDTWVDGLFAGQTLIVCGNLDNADGVAACEIVTIAKVEHVIDVDGGTVLTLAGSGLANRYVRSSVTIYGNVAFATNGETRQEVLGSGDASQIYQQFTLKQPPLTYVPATTASGASTTLKVYVNDVQWHEAPQFFGRGPRDRVFVTRTGDDGKTTVEFGDGLSGARLPTGTANLRAVYRQGIGAGGNVDADQLSMLLTRPLGIRGVTNPVAAAGGADPATIDQARGSAPLTVLTLDRIVSLQDYEDFARAFAGITKAQATWTWTGRARGVFVTVAGPDGPVTVPGPDDVTIGNMVSAMLAAGDPHVPLRVTPYRKAPFRLAARVKVDPDFQPDLVLPAVEAALRARFSFAARAFGQPVALSEVEAIIQSVPGVVAVQVTRLQRAGEAAGPAVNDVLPASAPQPGADGTVAAAELLTLEGAPLDLGVMP